MCVNDMIVVINSLSDRYTVQIRLNRDFIFYLKCKGFSMDLIVQRTLF